MTVETPETDRVGSLRVSYYEQDDTQRVAALEERIDLFSDAVRVLAAYHADHAPWRCPPLQLRYYPTMFSGTPCGAPNGGGCFASVPPKGPAIYLAGDPWMGRPRTLYHELQHVRLWDQNGDHDRWHQHPSWREVDLWSPDW